MLIKQMFWVEDSPLESNQTFLDIDLFNSP